MHNKLKLKVFDAAASPLWTPCGPPRHLRDRKECAVGQFRMDVRAEITRAALSGNANHTVAVAIAVIWAWDLMALEPSELSLVGHTSAPFRYLVVRLFAEEEDFLTDDPRKALHDG